MERVDGREDVLTERRRRSTSANIGRCVNKVNEHIYDDFYSHFDVVEVTQH